MSRLNETLSAACAACVEKTSASPVTANNNPRPKCDAHASGSAGVPPAVRRVPRRTSGVARRSIRVGSPADSACAPRDAGHGRRDARATRRMPSCRRTSVDDSRFMIGVVEARGSWRQTHQKMWMNVAATRAKAAVLWSAGVLAGPAARLEQQAADVHTRSVCPRCPLPFRGTRNAAGEDASAPRGTPHLHDLGSSWAKPYPMRPIFETPCPAHSRRSRDTRSGRAARPCSAN